jgi:hypothetical protein
MGAAKYQLADIAMLAVDIAETFKYRYHRELVEAASFLTKYVLIATLDASERSRVSEVSNRQQCPLCSINRLADGSCGSCILQDATGTQCGDSYREVTFTIKTGSFMDAMFHIGNVVKNILSKRRV